MVLVDGQWQEDRQGIPYPLASNMFLTMQDVEDWLANAIPPVTPVNSSPDSDGGDHNGSNLSSVNIISFLEGQDNVLETAGQMVNRMAELKALYSDPFSSQSNKDGYNTEFQDLQTQLFALSQKVSTGYTFLIVMEPYPLNLLVFLRR